MRHLAFAMMKPVTWVTTVDHTRPLRDPLHSTVLLAAIPDPYFGLLDINQSYRFYEFVPLGVPVDRAEAEQVLARVDYVVGSNCCSPPYLADYLTAHGKIEAQLGQRDFLSPPIVLWKLRDRRAFQ